MFCKMNDGSSVLRFMMDDLVKYLLSSKSLTIMQSYVPAGAVVVTEC